MPQGFDSKVLVLGSSLCNLCVSVVDEFRVKPHQRDTEDTEVAQRRARVGLFLHSRPESYAAHTD